MKRVFVDTQYWVASLISSDPWHASAIRAAAELGDAQLVTTEEVLVEFLSALGGRGEFLRERAVQTVHAILQGPGVTVRPQSHESFLAGLAFYTQRGDKAYSLVDCVSMLTMQELGITEALTCDHHFRQEGFTLLMTG